MTDAIIGTEFTEREIEILHLLSDGLSNKEIADRTGITLYTVKWYLKQLYSKLYVSNRTQAAAKARDMGLLDDEGDTSTPQIKVTSNFPQLFTTFLGRHEELRQLENLLSDDSVRLVTIHGLGGMGKTRLAVETANRYSDLFSDGVYFIPLAQFRGDPLQAIADIFRIAVDRQDDALDVVSAFLRDRQCLIVLDNFEHLVSQSSRIVDLLRQTRAPKLLVTSRELLQSRIERVFSLGGLGISDNLADIEQNGAYQLFLQRVHMVDVSYEPIPQEQKAIMAICKLVGGMPLAIELAAGWTTVLSVEETYKRLQKSLDLLESDEQDRPERQQSVRATFDYSWSMLDPKAQKVLISLGIFDVSGFTFAAAEQVAGATPRIIKQLRDAAIVQSVENKHLVFHPLIRQFVTEALQADEALYHEVAEKYGAYYYDFVVDSIEALRHNFDMRVVNAFLKEAFNLDIAWLYVRSKERYDWLLNAVEVGYLSDIVSLWSEVDNLFRNTLQVTPESEILLRGRLYAFRAIYAYRFNQLENLREFAHTSWDILKDTQYALDAGTAMAYYAIGESFLGEPKNGYAVLDEIETLLQRDDLPPNTYARMIIEAARPMALFFAGHSEKALPLLQDLEIPDWYELQVHLSECYISLGMIDEARTALDSFYSAALDSGYYKSAMSAAFYLSIIDSAPQELPDNVVRACIELTQISTYRPIIAQIAHYQGTQLMMRGHHNWGKMLLRGNLQMLNNIGEPFLMYRFALQTAKLMQVFQPVEAKLLFDAILSDPNCPPKVREDIVKLLKISPPTNPAGEHVLVTFDDVLLN